MVELEGVAEVEFVERQTREPIRGDVKQGMEELENATWG